MVEKTKRRVRVKRKAAVITAGDKTVLTKMINEHCALQLKIDEMLREQVGLSQNIHTRMRECGVEKWETKTGEAERYTPGGRATNLIDKAAFRERVSDEDFMESVSISTTKAKQVLSGKELDAISEKIPPVKKDEQLKIKAYKPE